MDSDVRAEVETLRERIREGERDITHERDRKLLLDLSDELDLRREEYGDYRHRKILRKGTRMAEQAGCLADAVQDRDASEDIVRWIHVNYENEESNRDYRTILRTIGRHATDDDDVPEALEWISTATSSDYDPVPRRSEMLEWDDDIKPMLAACHNPRDEALIALQFDAGLRGGELFDLRRGALSDSDHGLRVLVDGKTGEREITLIPSVPHVNKWLRDFPGEDADYLWTNLSTTERVSYRRYLDIFKDVAARAEVDKPVTPTNFRKSNMRWLVTLGMEQARIEDRQGRARGSEATARYLARFGADSNEKRYAELHGLEVVEQDDPEIAPVVCPRCEKQTPSDNPVCMWCGQALDAEAGDSEATLNEEMMLMLTDSDDDELTDALMDIRRKIDANPVLKALFTIDEH